MSEQWTIATESTEIVRPILPQTSYLPPYGYPRKCRLIKDKSEAGDPHFVHDQQIEVDGETLITCKEYLFNTEQESHDYLRQILRPMSQDISDTVGRLVKILEYINDDPVDADYIKLCQDGYERMKKMSNDNGVVKINKPSRHPISHDHAKAE